MLLLYRGEHFDPNFFYHAGVDIDHAFLLVHGSRKMLLVPKLNEALARSSFSGRVRVYHDPFEALSKLLRRRKVRIDATSLSARLAARLAKFCTPVDCSPELARLRSRKKPSEVRSIRKAVALTREILESLDFRAADTELDLKKQILLETVEQGLEPAFEPIVATARNTAFPHYSAGRKKLNSIVLVDYGVRFGHYCADLSRCYFLKSNSRKQGEYEKLQEILYSIIDGFPDFRTGRDVALFANSIMQKNGFPKMIHSIGHGIGLDIHELPSLSRKSETPLAGCTIAIEPAFYRSNYGMRYEETIYFDGRKARVL